MIHTILYLARWLNWLERPVHTREVESSSLSLATESKNIEKSVFFFVSGKLSVWEKNFNQREITL